MKRRFLLALMVVILGLIVVGCDSAGAGGGGSDTTQDETPDDGSGDGGSGDSGTSVPSDVPSDSTGAVDGTAYGYLELGYYGGSSGGYNTDLALYPGSDSSLPEFYIELWDGTDTIAIDAGTYTVDAGGSDASDGSITWVDIFGALNGSTLSYAASTEGTKSAFESEWGAVDVYDQITGGTVTISVSGSVYTVAWSLDSADGDTLAGSYTGSVDATF